MTKTALLASAAALALSAGNALAATPSAVAHGTPHRVVSVTPGSVTLYDQTSATLGNAVSSQHFSSGSFSALYDDQAADDFVVPSGKWVVKEIDVNGVNFGTHAAASLNVVFYKNKHGKPGAVKATCDNMSSAGYNGSGGYAIKLKGCATAPKLKAGTYWVSVQANQNFSTDSQWYWAGNGTIHGSDAQWQNPGGGFGLTQCTSWCDASNVFGYTADLSYKLIGVQR